LGPSNQLNPATFIEVSVPSQESEQSSIYVNGIDLASFYDFFLLHFENVPKV
jgi:hypothetical protein